MNIQDITINHTPDDLFLTLAEAISNAGLNPTFSEVAAAMKPSPSQFATTVLNFVEENPGRTVTLITEGTGLPQSTVAETLSGLKETGDIVTWGAKKGTLYYTVNNYITDDAVRGEIISALVSSLAEEDPKNQLVSRSTLILALSNDCLPAARIKRVLNTMISKGEITVSGVKKMSRLVLSEDLYTAESEQEPTEE